MRESGCGLGDGNTNARLKVGELYVRADHEQNANDVACSIATLLIIVTLLSLRESDYKTVKSVDKANEESCESDHEVGEGVDKVNEKPCRDGYRTETGVDKAYKNARKSVHKATENVDKVDEEPCESDHEAM